MILKQYYLACLSHASYLVGDEESRLAAVVDPQRDTDQYVEDATRLGLRIAYVFLTHFHADFVAGHLELQSRTGATICLGGRAQADYAFLSLADGDEVQLGRIRLVAMETPGHSPESICIVIHAPDTAPDRPNAVLTGDTLFVGDVGRPDLRASLGWRASELGSLLYRSLHEKVMTLPDDTLVYPAHGAGSMCGKSLSTETVSTIGEQRRTNYALRPMTEEQFIALVTADQPDAPAYFTFDAVLNTRRRPTLDTTLHSALHPLSAEQILRLANTGAQVLDTRDASEFEACYLLDSIQIGLGGKFATWAGTLLDPERPIAFLASPGREPEAATRLGRIGFDRIAGYLDGGIDALRDRPDLLRRIERVSPESVAVRTAAPVILDVRTRKEWDDGHIPGAMHFPLNQLPELLPGLRRNGDVVVHCQGGYRSAIAASLLARRGIEPADMVGGFDAWKQAGLPFETAPPASTGIAHGA